MPISKDFGYVTPPRFAGGRAYRPGATPTLVNPCDNPALGHVASSVTYPGCRMVSRLVGRNLPDMAEPAAAQVQTPIAHSKREPWAKQPNENDRWYGRFLRYIALGPTRSISILTKGRKNAYPVPAHWPAQAKQLNWLDRARAFDEAVKRDPGLVNEFNALLRQTATEAANGEAGPLAAAALTGYQVPPTDEDEEPSAQN